MQYRTLHKGLRNFKLNNSLNIINTEAWWSAHLVTAHQVYIFHSGLSKIQNQMNIKLFWELNGFHVKDSEIFPGQMNRDPETFPEHLRTQGQEIRIVTVCPDP